MGAVSNAQRRNRTLHPASIAATLLIAAAFPCWTMLRQMQMSTDRHALFEAIRGNDAAKVKALLKAGSDPNLRELPARRSTLPGLIDSMFSQDRNNEEPTPLLAALYHGEHTGLNQTEITYNPRPNPEIVRALLDKGADPNATDRARTAPIAFAVYSDNTEVAGLLLMHGASVSQRDFAGRDLFLASAAQGRIDMMRYLMAHGLPTTDRDAYGETALIYTVRFARMPDAVKLLIDHGVDVNAKDRSGKTALFYAKNPARALSPAQTSHLPEVIAVLKKAGAK